MNHRVVLVDDVPEIRQILRLILEHAGPFEVVGEGSNGRDAVALAAELRPDLLVMDVEMRGGPTGWEVLPEIRSAAPGTAVVILSGSAVDPLQRERGALADGVLEKGLSPQELNDALLGILGAPAGTRSADGDRKTGARDTATPSRAASDGASAADGVLTALLAATSDAVFELSPDLEIRSWNPGAESLYGVSAAEAVGRTFASLSPSGAPTDLTPLLDRLRRGEPVDRARVLHTGAGGEPVVVAFTLVTVPDGLVAIARDLSARQESDEALAWALSQLESQSRELSRVASELEGFASVASHDLAQPLQVAYGYLEMVRAEFSEGMDETAAVWIDNAIGSLERMRRLVQDILAYARGGNRDLPAVPVDLAAVVESALAGVEPLIDERLAEVRVPTHLPVVVANEGQLAPVLEELLANAITFVPAGTTPVVDVLIDETGSDTIVSIADNGPGIPPALTDRVFDLFYRGPKDTNAGTGLGLSTCRKLVQRMGGRIWVEGRPDGSPGACFRFTIPGGHPDGAAAER